VAGYILLLHGRHPSSLCPSSPNTAGASGSRQPAQLTVIATSPTTAIVAALHDSCFATNGPFFRFPRRHKNKSLACVSSPVKALGYNFHTRPQTMLFLCSAVCGCGWTMCKLLVAAARRRDGGHMRACHVASASSVLSDPGNA